MALSLLLIRHFSSLSLSLLLALSRACVLANRRSGAPAGVSPFCLSRTTRNRCTRSTEKFSLCIRIFVSTKEGETERERSGDRYIQPASVRLSPAQGGNGSRRRRRRGESENGRADESSRRLFLFLSFRSELSPSLSLGDGR